MNPHTDDVAIIRGSDTISSLAVEQAVMSACAGQLGVQAVMAFAVPHEQHGHVVGVAVVGDTSRTITIAQLRQCTARAGLVPKRWLPEVLVLVKALPTSRDGLAESLQQASVQDKHGMRNVDLRKPAPSHEVAKRSAARSAAAKRAAQKSNAAVGGGDQSDATTTARLLAAWKQGGSTCTVRGCVALVVLAMSEVCGTEVSGEDNLFEAGLTSITAAKLRAALAEATGLAIPPDLLLVHAGVSSLGGAIYRALRASREARAAATAEAAAEGGEGGGAERGGGGGGGGGSAAEEELMPLLLAEATERMRAGDLEAAEATCLRGAAAAGLPVAAEWWQHAPISVDAARAAVARGMTTAELAPRSDGAAAPTEVEPAAPTPTPTRAALPLLATLTRLWPRPELTRTPRGLRPRTVLYTRATQASFPRGAAHCTYVRTPYTPTSLGRVLRTHPPCWCPPGGGKDGGARPRRRWRCCSACGRAAGARAAALVRRVSASTQRCCTSSSLGCSWRWARPRPPPSPSPSPTPPPPTLPPTLTPTPIPCLLPSLLPCLRGCARLRRGRRRCRCLSSGAEGWRRSPRASAR